MAGKKSKHMKEFGEASKEASKKYKKWKKEHGGKKSGAVWKKLLKQAH